MTRAIAIISCLIATLFLVPIQADCSEITEYESETEIGCCIVVDSLSQQHVADQMPKLSLASDIVRYHACISVNQQKHFVPLPARILNCVFRE